MCLGVLCNTSASADWQRFGPREGLLGVVTAMVEDHSGNLWFATQRGVNRYDGVAWSSWTFPGAENCFDVYEDRSGNIWVGTYHGGVLRYDGVSWRTFTIDDGLVSNDGFVIYQDRRGDIWVGTDYYGVSRFDGVSWSRYTDTNGLASNGVYWITEDTRGNLWFSGSGGVSRFDGTSWSRYPAVGGPMAADRNGNMWFANSWVFRFDGVNWRSFTYAETGINNNNATMVAADRRGNVWVGGNASGVSRWDGSSWKHFGDEDGVLASGPLEILEDRDGDLWFAYVEGLNRFDGVSWKTYTAADGLGGDYIHHILEDRHGGLWVASPGIGVPPGIVARWDKTSWKSYTAPDPLGQRSILSMLQDHAGNLWFATYVEINSQGSGVSRFDGRSWQSFAPELFGGSETFTLVSMVEDRSGNMWFGGYGIVRRFDGTSWRDFTQADGIPPTQVVLVLDGAGLVWAVTGGPGSVRYDGSTWTSVPGPFGMLTSHVDRSGNLWFGTVQGAIRVGGDLFLFGMPINRIAEDHQGNLWFATSGFGVARFDGSNWTQFRAADGLASDYVSDIAIDTGDGVWVVSNFGQVSRFDGSTWRTYPVVDQAYENLTTVFADRTGTVWFGTSSGTARITAERLSKFNTGDGLVNNSVRHFFEDRQGRIWMGTPKGVSVHEPDRVSPRTVLTLTARALSSSREQTFNFAAAYGEGGVEFSTALDDTTWSGWSPISFLRTPDLQDGVHTFRVRARDHVGNVDPYAATATFEIDATPPAPVFESPTFGAVVRDSMVLLGQATDQRFKEYQIDYRAIGALEWTELSRSDTAVTSGVVGGLETRRFPDGDLDLRLSCRDTLGLVGSVVTRITIDNLPPSASQTSPVRIVAATGGDVFTTDGDAHLYLPPHAFGKDALVTLAPLDAGVVPETLPDGARRVAPGFRIEWVEAVLTKAATLDIAISAEAAPTHGAVAKSGELALYTRSGADWTRVGGTVEAGTERLASAIRSPGLYAVFTGGSATAPGELSELSITPRVFSPHGSFATADVAIGFMLARAASANIRVYNRAGRLVREVVHGAAMNAGANLIRWDGRDRGGAIVEAGIYLVSVEALGRTETRTVAVVN